MSEINVTPFNRCYACFTNSLYGYNSTLTVGIPVDLPKVKASALTDQGQLK